MNTKTAETRATYAKGLAIVGLLLLAGCSAGHDPSEPFGEPQPAAVKPGSGTVLASVTTSNGHAIQFVELKAADVVIVESMTQAGPPLVNADSRGKSLAEIFRMADPTDPVPEAILAADARLAQARATHSHDAPAGMAPEGPLLGAGAAGKFTTDDAFYDQFCAPSDNVYCVENVRIGRVNPNNPAIIGPWAWGEWFQVAGWVEVFPASYGATLGLDEWQCPNGGCQNVTVYSHDILPGNYWYLTRAVIPGTYHRGSLVTDVTTDGGSQIGGFAERSDPSVL